MIHIESHFDSQETSVMKQLTLRGFDEELTRRIRQLARKEGISLNRAALLLMRRGAGLSSSSQRDDLVGSSLDDLMGTWSDEEVREFNEATADLATVDEAMWK
jgi:hypothetical protein